MVDDTVPKDTLYAFTGRGYGKTAAMVALQNRISEHTKYMAKKFNDLVYK